MNAPTKPRPRRNRKPALIGTAEHRPAARRRRYRHDELVAVDLFSGFGGLTQGIERAGFSVIMAANHSRYKVQVHEANHPNAEHWVADLVDPDAADYHSARDLPAGDLLVAGVSCFAAGAFVLTRRGLTPIESVEVGDEVWTHRSRWRPVTHTSTVERPTVTVNATAPITCTPDHPFLAADATRTRQPRRRYQDPDGARCLGCGGPVATHRRGRSKARLYCSRACSQDAANERAVPVLGAPEQTRADALAGRWVGSPILKDDDTDLPTVDGVGVITPDLAWVLGRWVGDGWLSRRRERRGVWSRVTICASHAESDALAKELTTRTDLPWNRTRQRTTDTFHVSRCALAGFLAEQFGHGAAAKSLPTWLLFAPEPVRRAFVDGYLAADGHESRDGLRVQASSVSKALAVGTRLLLTSLGYYATLHHQKRSPEATIEGRTVHQRDSWTVTGHLVRDRRPKHRDADGYRWGKPSGAITPGETTTVYNMTVAEDHTYVVDGVLVHNCVNHSQANSQKAYAGGASLFDLDDPDYEARVTRSERDRATANCVLAYAAQHHPRMMIVECTTELVSWGPALPGKRKVGDGSTYRWWLREHEKLGYRYRELRLNSMFFGVPQSRDRLYIVFWDRGMPAPDLDHCPLSWCPRCDTAVEAVWSWRTGVPATGSVRYAKQYDYRCPSCRTEVHPPAAPSLRALDLTDLGTRIGDRPIRRHRDGSTGPMAAATLARARRCMERFGEFPAVLMPAKSMRGVERHPWQPLATQTSQQETALLSTGAAIVAAGNTFEWPGSDCRTRGLDEPLWTQPATNTTGLLTPPVALAVDNYQGAPRGAGDPLPTQVGSETIGLVSSGVIPFRQNTLPTTHAESMPTVTADQIPGLLTAAATIKNNGAADEAKYRAHGLDDPLGTLVGSAASQAVLFGGWYKQNGPTGTETAPHPLTDPYGTLTSRDTTALLFTEWRARLAALELEDCYFRMMAPHEVGRGCGFDVDFPDHRGAFIVWGSSREQVDGYGNAVSPPVGYWLGDRCRVALHAETVA